MLHDDISSSNAGGKVFTTLVSCHVFDWANAAHFPAVPATFGVLLRVASSAGITWLKRGGVNGPFLPCMVREEIMLFHLRDFLSCVDFIATQRSL